jgi:CRISPR system Cascade subunit CasC
MTPRFLQLHTLTSYPASLLNRDDAGFAKRIPFGGTIRTRVSSQCLKRHWRTFDGKWSLSEINAPESIRSRLTFDRFVLQPLLSDGIAPAVARAAVEALMVHVLGESVKAKKAKSKDENGQTETLQTGQVTVLGRPEIEYLLAEARAVCADATTEKEVSAAVKARLDRDAKQNLRALGMASGLGAALFGRMVTSDVLARGDAAIHVAHAFTVHEQESESDYFSAVDDLLQQNDAELGSGHIGSSELTSGLFYGYVVVDVPLLVSNLEGCQQSDWLAADRSQAGQVMEHLVHLAATVSPGAKRGSTAPYAYAHMVAVELGDAQPRTLANAFLRPVRERPDLLANTYDALEGYVRDSDAMYGNRSERRLSAIAANGLGAAIGAGDPMPLPELAQWVRGQVDG